MVTGSILLTIGLFLMGTISYDTNYVLLSVYMLVLGAGVGMVMQNLVLVVQNSVSPRELGTASSSVTFFRSLGGTAGVSVMGSILGTTVAGLMSDKANELGAAIAKLGAGGAKIAEALQAGTIPAVSTLPKGVRVIIESVYGQSVAHVFLIAVPLAIITIIAVALIPNKLLGTKTTIERLADEGQLAEAETTVVDVAEAMVAVTPNGLAEEETEAESKKPGGASGL